MNRSSLGWGLALLLLGGLMLANAAGVRLPGGASPMDFFWPVLLIGLGGWLILGVFVRPRYASEQASIDLQGASEAAVRISHAAGELRITGGTGPGELANGTFAGGLEQAVKKEGQKLVARLNPPQSSFIMVPKFDRHDWDLRLNSEIPMALVLQTGADNALVDLSALLLTSLKVETGASQTQITLPCRGRSRADFNLGAASLRLTVPEGTAARVRVSQGVSSVRIDETRFPRAGDFYQSPDFEAAANAVDIKIDAGAADIIVQ
jgi:hypothetical protein